MDNAQSKNTPRPSKKSPPSLWFLLTIVVVAALFIGAYWLTERNDNDDNVTIMSNTNNNINTNTNTNVNSNTNSNANANANSNFNANQNINAVVVTNTPTTVKFQRYDHGFQITLPVGWTYTMPSSGLQEDYTLVSMSELDDDNTIYGDINFHNLGNDTLALWAENNKNSRTQGQTSTALTMIDQTHYSYETTYRSQDGSGSTTYVLFAQDGERVYTISLSCNLSVYENKKLAIRGVADSLQFIDPLPYQTVQQPVKTSSVSTADTITVDWATTPAELNLYEPELLSPDAGTRVYYDVGTITNGNYNNQTLVDIFETPMGPAFKPNLYRVAYDASAKSFTYFEKHSDDMQYIVPKITYDTQSTIPDLTVPAEIAIPGSSVSLSAEPYDPNAFFSAYNNSEKEFEANGRAVYYDIDHGCFMIRTADGLVKQYHYKLPFAKNFTEREYFYAGAAMTPDVTWTDTSLNTVEYTFNEALSGCGNSNCHAIYSVGELGGLSALKQTGQTSTGDPVYEYADSNAEALHGIYDLFYVPTEETKVTYEAFVADHPVFFWSDPFGRYVQFKKVGYVPAAECGKPVIYLYPEKDTQVNVQVRPTGGFTVTEPVYPSGGWSVLARPDGQLKTLAGEEYPYLFWEGIGLNYEIPKQGFVVSRAEVGQFLKEKLAILGLNEKESAEFIEFWQIKLEVKPYVFITFIDQAVFDQLAPLTVTPKPDQVIRVFMDYTPLDNKISVQPQKLVTPVRSGFTVVEWGGALHR